MRSTYSREKATYIFPAVGEGSGSRHSSVLPASFVRVAPRPADGSIAEKVEAGLHLGSGAGFGAPSPSARRIGAPYLQLLIDNLPHMWGRHDRKVKLTEERSAALRRGWYRQAVNLEYISMIMELRR